MAHMGFQRQRANFISRMERANKKRNRKKRELDVCMQQTALSEQQDPLAMTNKDLYTVLSEEHMKKG